MSLRGNWIYINKKLLLMHHCWELTILLFSHCRYVIRSFSCHDDCCCEKLGQKMCAAQDDKKNCVCVCIWKWKIYMIMHIVITMRFSKTNDYMSCKSLLSHHEHAQLNHCIWQSQNNKFSSMKMWQDARSENSLLFFLEWNFFG